MNIPHLPERKPHCWTFHDWPPSLTMFSGNTINDSHQYSFNLGQDYSWKCWPAHPVSNKTVLYCHTISSWHYNYIVPSENEPKVSYDFIGTTTFQERWSFHAHYSQASWSSFSFIQFHPAKSRHSHPCRKRPHHHHKPCVFWAAETKVIVGWRKNFKCQFFTRPSGSNPGWILAQQEWAKAPNKCLEHKVRCELWVVSHLKASTFRLWSTCPQGFWTCLYLLIL